MRELRGWSVEELARAIHLLPQLPGSSLTEETLPLTVQSLEFFENCAEGSSAWQSVKLVGWATFLSAILNATRATNDEVKAFELRASTRGQS